MTNFNTQTIDNDTDDSDKVQDIIDDLADVDINDELEFAAAPVRTLPEIRTSKAQFSRQMRSKLSVKEKLAMIKEATTGLETKMGKIDHESINGSNDEQLENNVEVETFLYKMEKHLLKFDMAKIFEKFPILDEDETGANRWRSRKTVNLLTAWDQIGNGKQITLNQIAESLEWMKLYATEASASFLDDVEWSHTFLLNSMEEDLQESVHMTLIKNFRGECMGGPLTFAIMIDKIINLSEIAIEGMISHIKQYEIKSVPGENVEKICRRFQYALKRLENNGSLSRDLITALFKVFQTTTVTEYNELFKLWKRSLDLTGETRPTYQQILDKAMEWYSNMMVAGEWKIDPLSTSSTFKTENRTNNDKSAWTTPPDGTCKKVSTNPDRFEKKIGSKKVKWCTKCGNRNLPGRWTTSHYSDEHVPRNRLPEDKANTANLADKNELPDQEPSNKTDKAVSWGDALAQAANRK